MDIKEVIESLNAKMIRRHPHIFGEAQADSMDDLKDIWSAAKDKEGKKPRVTRESICRPFLKLYDETKNKHFDEDALRNFYNKGRIINHEIR